MRSMADFEKERKRLEKQMAKIKKDLDGLQKCLNSPGFADKVPPAVIEQKISSAVELEAQLSGLTTRLEDIVSSDQTVSSISACNPFLVTKCRPTRNICVLKESCHFVKRLEPGLRICSIALCTVASSNRLPDPLFASTMEHRNSE